MSAARRLALLLLLLSAGVGVPSPGRSERIATMDWTIAETLLALGVVPAGVGEIAGYRAWVGAPEMPDGVRDIGLRAQPNIEVLTEMAPDRIMLSRMFRSLEPILSPIAPTSMIDNQAGGDAWEGILVHTRQIGRQVGRGEEAEALIRSTDRHLREAAAAVGPVHAPVLVVQFMDAVHVRVFGRDSLYGMVLDRLGIRNAWTRPVNSWGFSLVSLDHLAGIDARMLVVEPVPVGVDPTGTGVWNALPSVRRGDVLRLPPTWSFGALPSARRFADALADAL